MKKHMMIVGCEIVSSNEKNTDESIFKITLMPLTTVRKVTSMKHILNLGSMEEMIDASLSHQNTQMKDSIYITLAEWRDKQYKIGRHVTIELLPDNTTGGIK